MQLFLSIHLILNSPLLPLCLFGILLCAYYYCFVYLDLGRIRTVVSWPFGFPHFWEMWKQDRGHDTCTAKVGASACLIGHMWPLVSLRCQNFHTCTTTFTHTLLKWIGGPEPKRRLSSEMLREKLTKRQVKRLREKLSLEAGQILCLNARSLLKEKAQRLQRRGQQMLMKSRENF